MWQLQSNALFRWMDGVEFSCCLFCNRVVHERWMKPMFVAISRLGNGVFWYCLIALLAVLGGEPGLQAAIHMLSVGLVCVIIYKVLKGTLVRQRPCIAWDQIKQGTVALDLYSFPSGHTLHAVAFSLVAIEYFPMLIWLLLPFTLLIMLSRVVLGLHYPTDVLVGASLGAVIAMSSFWF